MDKIKLGLLSQVMALCGQYSEFDLNNKFYMDNEVIDCQFKLYILLLTTDKKEQDKRFKEFEQLYKNLSKEKQEYIREDLRKIFKEQDKNNKEKEKKLWEKQ